MILTLAEENKEKTKELNVQTLNIGEVAVSTDSGKLPVYYVIVGCGTAAVVNHTTLRQTEWGKARIGVLPVMHIGFKDPWSEYFNHGMGQPPYLLSMPGYEKRPKVEDILSADNPGCSSKVFGKCSDDEWKRLWNKYHNENKTTSRFEYINGWVAVIQKKGTPMSEGVKTTIEKLKKDESVDLLGNIEIKEKLEEAFKSEEADYRLVVIVPESEDAGKIRFVYAKKVDICTGLGRARYETRNKALNAHVNEAKTKLFVPPEMWKEETKKRKFVTGPEALMKTTKWNATDRIIVTSWGGIGLNMVERGEGEGCFGDWIYTATLHQSFNLPRNDTVLRHPTTGPNKITGATKENLIIYFKEKLKDVPDFTELVDFLKSKNFLGKTDLKTNLLLQARNRSSGLFLKIAQSNKILEELYPSGARMKEGESEVRQGPFQETTNTDFVLTSAIKKWRFGEYMDFGTVELEQSKIKVTFIPPGKSVKPLKIRDYFENDTGIEETSGAFNLSEAYKLQGIEESNKGKYDRICLINGFITQDLGEPFCVVPVSDFRFNEIFGYNNTIVGFKADDEKVRILGSAAQVHPNGLFKLDRTDTNGTSQYFNTLPVSAIVPGFIFSGINIALANKYFDDKHPNLNVNTVISHELSEWIKNKHSEYKYAATLARQIIKYRRFNNGYKDTESIIDALRDEEGIMRISEYEGWESIVQTLETNYPVSNGLLDSE